MATGQYNTASTLNSVTTVDTFRTRTRYEYN